MHADKELLLDVDNVAVRYATETALEKVSFCVHRGEFIGLIGPNGAGKTTLLKVVLGLIQPSTGHIKRSVHSIGYVPQRGNLYHGIVPISVIEVVSLGSRGSQKEARTALELVAMEHLADKRFSELSGGQQQRVIIAKALAAHADVLILDEPTTGIDDASQREFYALLRNLQQRGVTLIMVSHEVESVLTLVTRVLCINTSILYDGPPEHFESDAYLPQVYKAHHRRLHHHHTGGEHA